MSVKTFWLEPTGTARVWLRRYVSSSVEKCGDGYHDASVLIVEEAPKAEWLVSGDLPDRIPHDDPRWPGTCEACGRPFTDADQWQVFVRDLYAGAPDGELYTLRDAPAGATWDAHWMGDERKGPDGICLVVKLPNGIEWMPDGPAANSNALHGWTRTGDPRKANVTASPSIGSPWPPSSPRYYHGWLRNGELVPA